jgi:hypothetical protein
MGRPAAPRNCDGPENTPQLTIDHQAEASSRVLGDGHAADHEKFPASETYGRVTDPDQ